MAAAWKPAIKLSESPSKIPNPGPKAVWRIYDSRGNATADWLSLEDEDPTKMEAVELIHPMDRTRRRTLRRDEISGAERLLETVQEAGHRLLDTPESGGDAPGAGRRTSSVSILEYAG